jgi:stage V sporulation protein G
LKITEVRIRLKKKDDSKIKAIASITIDDCFVVHDIKVIEGTEGYFIAMPSRKTPEGEFKDIVHPLNSETRELLRTVVVEQFEKEKLNAVE